jgi:membrane protease YdiL (CAAX protease family)
VGCVWAIAGATVAGVLLRPLGERISQGSAAVLLTDWLVVALAEETAFRGVIQRRLARLSTAYVALPVASALFVLWHGWPADGVVLALRAGAALAFGLLYHLSGSLLPPILGHWLLNVALAL